MSQAVEEFYPPTKDANEGSLGNSPVVSKLRKDLNSVRSVLDASEWSHFGATCLACVYFWLESTGQGLNSLQFMISRLGRDDKKFKLLDSDAMMIWLSYCKYET